MKYFNLLYIVIFFIGCIQTKTSIQRVDSKSIHLTTIHWGTEDLEEMAKEMVVSILKSDAINFKEKNIFSFLKIKNSTYDHIDTDSLADSIKIGLIKSKKVMIVDKDKKDALFSGEISAIYQKNSLKKDMFFKFTLNLIDIKTAEIIWSHEVEIRKIRRKDLISW